MSATIDHTPVAAQPVPRTPGRSGPTADPRWARPALLVLLAATGVLYLWDLSASGWANSYYAAAVQAGSQNWTAWFFGSLDAGNAITVDKPPASLWVMGLSARVFGFSSASMLAPQALAGVASVGLLYAAVKRWSGPVAGLVAGAALALTPAAALMFRFNNPDALLTLLLVAAAYCLIRAMDAGATARRWVVLCGAALGFAFLAKMLQGFLVVPGFALTYLIAAPTTVATRIRHTLLAGASMIVSAGWYVAAVELWPASARPYIGGSTNNSLLDLVLGYNGLSRITGGTGGSPGGGGTGGVTGGAFGGATGLGRLFGSEMAVEVSWLLPAALLALGFGLWTTRRAPRTDHTRAALLLWGTWLAVTGLVFSYMSGVVHPYYTVALAPAVAALVAVGGRVLWQRRESAVARIGLAVVTLGAGGWGYVLLARNGTWHPELRYAVLAVSVVAALGLVAPPWRLGRRVSVAVITGAVLAGLAAPAAYAVVTAATAHSGSIPTVGPAGASGTSDGLGGGPGGGSGGGGPSGTRGSAPSAPPNQTGQAPAAGGMTGAGAGQGGQPGGSTSSAELVALLQASTQRWAAATSGAQSAASLELASGASVIGIGGFTGSDPAPTLAQFKEYVAQGLVHYFVVGGQGGQGGGPGGDRGSSNEIATWVSSSFTATTVGGATVYDLTATA